MSGPDEEGVPMLRYALRCPRGHETTWETSEWPGLVPVHCQHPDCWHEPVRPVGEPERFKLTWDEYRKTRGP